MELLLTTQKNLTLTFIISGGNFSEHDIMPVLQHYKREDHWFSKPTEIVLTVIYCVIIVLGLLGNGIVCLIVGRKKNLRSTRNMFIVNLAASDIMMCIISMPFTLIKLTMKNWHLGKVLCKMVPAVHMTDVFVSTATIVAIAIDKFRFIVYAKRKSSSKKTVVHVLMIIWALSIALAIPVFIVSDVKAVTMVDDYIHYDICMEDWPSMNLRGAYTILLVLVQYLLPLVVISCLHARICYFLRLRITESPSTQSQFERAMRAIQRHRKNMTLLTAIALTFGITWLPLTLLNIMADYDYRIFMDSNFNLGYAICHLIAMLSASTNPIIYGWLNPNFRKEFLSVLFSWRRRKEGSESVDEEDLPMNALAIGSSAIGSSSSRPSTNYRSTSLFGE